jgi:hypothetical protein
VISVRGTPDILVSFIASGNLCNVTIQRQRRQRHFAVRAATAKCYLPKIPGRVKPPAIDRLSMIAIETRLPPGVTSSCLSQALIVGTPASSKGTEPGPGPKDGSATVATHWRHRLSGPWSVTIPAGLLVTVVGGVIVALIVNALSTGNTPATKSTSSSDHPAHANSTGTGPATAGSGSSNRFSRPDAIAVDGTHIWVANFESSTVTELNTSDGNLVRVLAGHT